MLRARFSPLRIAVALSFATALLSLACQVPVFRYALERWEPASYLVSIVPASGGLSAVEQKLVEQLRTTPELPVNLDVQVESPAKEDQARIALRYPHKLREAEAEPIWQGPLTAANVQLLLDSPVRLELRKRLLTGQTAVWLFVESGNAPKDEAAIKALTQALEQAQAAVKLPDGVVGRNESGKSADPVNTLQSDLPLKVEFSLLRLRRDDPQEAALLAMLLHMEPDLKDFAGEPMAFPVFGRGRMLEPLIGAGIHDGNVLEHAAYLCGACSCEVKDQNPGIDLLVAADWSPVDTTPKLEIVRITPSEVEVPPAGKPPVGVITAGLALLGLGAWWFRR
ncbi:hypothetical protein [Prosthecobacter sp.]|uniref:hypothetical protein n=1 Tax=Prosthecobacter sp. TaxID=1965333 RepID=UPI002AB85C8D|nr:hypothetical protein [Prosthecobacter sp.]MDZ4401363.1 hypothetical protein [Prosthecobacter sp.]